MVSYGFSEESLTSSGHTIQDDSLGGFDSDFLIKLGVGEWQLNSLLDLPDLGLEATNICIRLKRCLVYLHHTNHGVHFILQNTNNSVRAVVQQH